MQYPSYNNCGEDWGKQKGALNYTRVFHQKNIKYKQKLVKSNVEYICFLGFDFFFFFFFHCWESIRNR